MDQHQIRFVRGKGRKTIADRVGPLRAAVGKDQVSMGGQRSLSIRVIWVADNGNQVMARVAKRPEASSRSRDARTGGAIVWPARRPRGCRDLRQR